MCGLESRNAGDVPMSRVKMNAKHEYEFLVNYKVMQTFFKNKKIDKVRLLRTTLHMLQNQHSSSAYTRRQARQVQNAVCSSIA